MKKGNEIFISYTARYAKKTEKQIKAVEKFVFSKIVEDKKYAEQLLTIHQAKTNKVKVKKIIKIIILNLIRAIHNDSELTISLDNNVLRQNGLNLRLFSSVINKLFAMDFIQIKKGYFYNSQKHGKRSRITASGTLKNSIIKATTEYIQEIEATFNDWQDYEKIDKVKLIFIDAKNQRYAVFKKTDDPIFELILQKQIKKEKFKLKINSKNRIVDIK